MKKVKQAANERFDRLQFEDLKSQNTICNKLLSTIY